MKLEIDGIPVEGSADEIAELLMRMKDENGAMIGRKENASGHLNWNAVLGRSLDAEVRRLKRKGYTRAQAREELYTKAAGSGATVGIDSLWNRVHSGVNRGWGEPLSGRKAPRRKQFPWKSFLGMSVSRYAEKAVKGGRKLSDIRKELTKLAMENGVSRTRARKLSLHSVYAGKELAQGRSYAHMKPAKKAVPKPREPEPQSPTGNKALDELVAEADELLG